MGLTFCSDTAVIWQFVGHVLFVFKIVIPLIIIIIGMIDLGKAVVASDEDQIKKASTSLLKRFIAGVIIFFIPVIVGAMFNILSSFGEVKDQYQICAKCITHPNKCVVKD